MNLIPWSIQLLLLLAVSDSAPVAPALEPWQLEPASPLEAQLLEDMADGQLQQFSLLEAALIASGVDSPTVLTSYTERFSVILQRSFEVPQDQVPDAGHEARAILDWLHHHVLTGDYQPACTEIDRTLETGNFNCVTSTILYRCLADAHGVTVETLSQPDHVFCRAPGSPPIIIQTTSPTGVIDLASSAGLPRNAMISSASRSPERVLSDVQLVAKIYYNRGVLSLENYAHAAALAWLSRAADLDAEDATARSNLLACINNSAIYEAQAGDFPGALQLLERGKMIAPDYEAFYHNEVYVYYTWARHLSAHQRFAEALEVLDEAARRYPAVPVFARGRMHRSLIGLDGRDEIQPAATH
jgi:tetratricopeptide (TPR) repeat protein